MISPYRGAVDVFADAPPPAVTGTTPLRGEYDQFREAVTVTFP
jgi:hypothetical protein